MGAISISEALDLESTALANGWSGEQLLNLAGESLGHSIARFFPTPGTVVGYLGKGHNAGDALVALHILRDLYGWEVATRNAFSIHELTPISLRKWDELGLATPLDRVPSSHEIRRPLVLLDGLLGTGATGRLREPLLALAREMSDLRQRSGARVAAVDMPSGIDADTGEIFENTVIADVTFMIGNAKRGLLESRAANAVGALALVPVEPLTARDAGEMDLICPQAFDFGKSPRPFDSHKGMAGRVAVVAGSAPYTGAAVLAASGSLRGGAGLITLFVPSAIHSVVTGKCPPEIIVRGYRNPLEVMETRFDSLVIGCGLGQPDRETSEAMLEVIASSPAPTVIDADALNLIAELGRTDIFRENHVVTPHPGEFARLAPDLAAHPREEAARRFTDRTPATLLLKGCRTLVTHKGHSLRCNSTGTPAMATGGQGDLLSGVIGARLATGESPLDAATLAAWLCGRAAEIASNDRRLSEESLVPTDVLEFIGAAYRDWQTSGR